MKAMVKECLQKKVVWPWIPEDGSQKDQLKSNGYKEWKQKNAKKGRQPQWSVRYDLEVTTGN